MPPILAANYSPELVSLLEASSGIVDAVKVSEFYEPAYVALYRALPVPKPFVLHGLCQDTRNGRRPSLGMEGFRESLDIPALRTAMDLCGPRYISLHLESHSPVHPPPSAFLESLARDAELVRSLTGLSLHLENTHYNFPRPGRVINAPYACDPAFIREALTRSQSKLLFDLAHAQAAAWHRGESAEDYIMQLPLELVDEVHVTGPAMVDGELRDRHVEIEDGGYNLLRMVLESADVKTVSLEYGGLGPLFEGRSSKDVLQRQLLKLRDMTCRLARGRRPRVGNEDRTGEDRTGEDRTGKEVRDGRQVSR